MAITLASDLKIYEEYLDAGFTEVMTQEVDVFNNGSAGAILLGTEAHRGAYRFESFFKELTSFDTRRDLTSTSDVDPKKLVQDEMVAVKLSRKQGPVEGAIGAFKRKGLTEQTMSFMLGQQSARKLLQIYLNKSLLACRAATANQTDMVHDATDGTIETADFVSGMEKYGDDLSAVTAVVMHSKVFYDLFRDQLANFKIENVAGIQIARGDLPGVLGRPFVVTDSSSLVETDGVTSGTDKYYTPLLKSGAIDVDESQEPTAAIEVQTGKEQITIQWQFEYDFSIELMGYKWDTSNGGENPNDSALSTGTNWDKAVTSDKNLAAAMIESQ